jgi:hypothetical protein
MHVVSKPKAVKVKKESNPVLGKYISGKAKLGIILEWSD